MYENSKKYLKKHISIIKIRLIEMSKARISYRFMFEMDLMTRSICEI